MKTYIALVFSSLFFISLIEGQNTQDLKLQNLKSNKLEVETDYLDVKIKTWDNNYIQIKPDIKINLGQDDDAHKLKTKNNSNAIVVRSSIDTEEIQKMVITTDKEGNKTYTPVDQWDETMKGKAIESLNFGFEIDGTLTILVPKSMKVHVESLYGDMNVEGSYKSVKSHSTYGMIEARLDDVSSMTDVSFKSTYDIVDLVIDKGSSASLNLKTSYGSVFSDLPLESKRTNSSKNRHNHHGCSNFSERYVLNDGDVNIDIVATYDNIYVRSF